MNTSDEGLRSAGPERDVQTAVVGIVTFVPEPYTGANARTEGAPESKPDSET